MVFPALLVKCIVAEVEQDEVKGTISDSLRLRKISKTLQNLRKICVNHSIYHFFLENCIILTEKQLFIRFHFVGPEHCFSPWENSLNNRVKLHVSL